MNEFIRKLTSRKLWMAIAGVATGIFLAVGGDSSEIQSIAGAITAVISAISYIIVEGKVDAESVKNAIIEVEDVVDMLGEDNQ